MCGICGIISLSAKNETSITAVETMLQYLAHRGPDDSGYISRGPVAIGNTRLSILDISADGHQPMCNEDKTVWIVFNGEIYNFKDLRSSLLTLGHLFKSKTDTEVILHAYEEWGISFLDQLDGMFAFAIWDSKSQQVFIARDRSGEKPFYYSLTNDHFYFSSEFRALIKVLPTCRDIDPVGLDLYFSYLFIPPPYTIFSNVRQLPAAHYMILNIVSGDISINRYWDFPNSSTSLDSPIEKPEYQVRELLKNSVVRRLQSDVPVGVLLSGGVDSAAVVASMREEMSGDIQTFTIGSTDPSLNELDYAREVSNRFGTIHHEFIVSPEAGEVLPLLVMHYGQPFADSSAIPMYYVSKMARQCVTVALSGDGGDEVFSGYGRYRTAWWIQRINDLPPILQAAFKKLLSLSHNLNINYLTRRIDTLSKLLYLDPPQAFANSFALGLIGARPSIYKSAFLSALNVNNAIKVISDNYLGSNASSLLDRWIQADLKTMLPGDYLIKVDIASMACSLEVRTPYLSSQMINFSYTLPNSIKMPGGSQKFLLKSAFRGILPDSILDHKKMGFQVPVHSWLRNDLSQVVDELILSGKSHLLNEYLDAEKIRQLVLAQRNSDNTKTSQVWSLLNLVLWEKIFLDNTAPLTAPKLQDLI